MAQLFSILKDSVALSDEDLEHKVEGWEMQMEYSHFRLDLNHLRTKSATLSSQKVALCVPTQPVYGRLHSIGRHCMYTCIGVGFGCTRGF